MPTDPKNSPGAYHYDPQFIKESLTHPGKSQMNSPLITFLKLVQGFKYILPERNIPVVKSTLSQVRQTR